jgi:hypothetical protein
MYIVKSGILVVEANVSISETNQIPIALNKYEIITKVRVI